MKVRKLIEALQKQNPEDEVRVAMFYGPGSPSAQTYPVSAVRASIATEVWIAADDFQRPPPSTSVGEAAARDIRHAADRLRAAARTLERLETRSLRGIVRDIEVVVAGKATPECPGSLSLPVKGELGNNACAVCGKGGWLIAGRVPRHSPEGEIIPEGAYGLVRLS